MSVAEFRAFLLATARLYREAGAHQEADALTKFAELFDGSQNPNVATFAAQLSKARARQAA